MLSNRMSASWLMVALAVFSLAAARPAVPLIEAVKGGNREALRDLLRRNHDVNAPQIDGTTALHWAVNRDDVEAVELLIRAGADVNVQNRYGVAPLTLACVNGNAVITDKLLKSGANPNTVQPSGETALMTAARTGHAGVVKALLARGADVNAREARRQQTALMWAAAENNAAAAQALIDAGADIHARSRSTGALSVQEPGDRSFTALLFAIQGGAIDAAQTLLSAGADVNETLPDGTGGLVLAIANAQFDTAAFLLDQRANPNASEQGWTALHQLIWNRRPNQGLNQVFPVLRGQVDSMDLVKKLLAHGADINARVTKEPNALWVGRATMSRIGATPFFLASHKFDVDLMRLLLASGADPHVGNKENTTPLMVAAGLGVNSLGENPGTVDEIAEAVKLCLEVGGGDVNAVNAKGETALHGAAYTDSTGAVKLLLAANARLDVADSKGWTPLRVASGVPLNAAIKAAPAVAAQLRQVMLDRGLSISAEEQSTTSSVSKQK